MERLQDRVAVVTGAGSGIGLASVRRLAAEGAKIVAVDINEPAGQAAAAQTDGIFLAADVAREDQVRHLYEEVAARFGRVDIAFNNAGISPPEDDSILTTGLEAWRRVQEINLTSVYLCCKYALPHMQRQGKGSIINTASFVAVLGAATSQISYTASKGGVLAMSRELGVQFAREGVRVNALCPGPVNTPLLRELFAADPERAARRLVHVPLGRFAEPAEIAAAVAFLASDDASFITASSFLVDGGIAGAYVTPLLRQGQPGGGCGELLGVRQRQAGGLVSREWLPPGDRHQLLQRAGPLGTLGHSRDGAAAPLRRPGGRGRRNSHPAAAGLRRP